MGAAAAGIAGVQLISGFIESENMKEMGAYQKEMADKNAAFAKEQADYAIQRGDKAALEYGKKVNMTVGAQKVAFAAGGIDVGSGSAKAIQQETYAVGREDINTIKNNAFLEAMGYKQQAANYQEQGRMAQRGAAIESSATLIRGGLAAANTMYSNSGKGKS